MWAFPPRARAVLLQYQRENECYSEWRVGQIIKRATKRRQSRPGRRRRSARRRADTGNNGDGQDQGALRKRRALTGFRPAPPTFGNCRPRFLRRAFCVLRPSPSPPAVLTTVSPSLDVSFNIPDEWNGQHNGVNQNSTKDTPTASRRDLRRRHLSPITPSTHDGSRHVLEASPKHC